jgi:hypothetical protein
MPKSVTNVEFLQLHLDDKILDWLQRQPRDHAFSVTELASGLGLDPSLVLKDEDQTSASVAAVAAIALLFISAERLWAKGKIRVGRCEGNMYIALGNNLAGFNA